MGLKHTGVPAQHPPGLVQHCCCAWQRLVMMELSRTVPHVGQTHTDPHIHAKPCQAVLEPRLGPHTYRAVPVPH